MTKTTEELLDSSKKILAAMAPLSFEKYAVTKSYENYKKYKTGEKDKIEWFD